MLDSCLVVDDGSKMHCGDFCSVCIIGSVLHDKPCFISIGSALLFHQAYCTGDCYHANILSSSRSPLNCTTLGVYTYRHV